MDVKNSTINHLQAMIDIVKNDFKDTNYLELVNMCADLTLQICIAYESNQKNKTK